MADSKFVMEKVGDEVPGNHTFAVSGKRLGKHCQPCSTADMKTKAEYWCVDCSEYLCPACSKTHTRFAVSKDHIIVAASDADRSSISYDMKGIDQCKEHRKKLKFVCEDHNMLCCSTCAIANHRTCHNVVELGNKAKTSTVDLTSVTRDLLDIEGKVKAYAQRLMNIRGKVTSSATEITKKIQMMQDKTNEMFENLKKNVAKEMHTFQQKAFHDIERENDVCNSIAANVTDDLSDVDNVIKEENPAQQLIMAYHLQDRVLAHKMRIYNDISELKDINMSFDFNTSIQLPPTNNTTLGKLTMKYVPDRFDDSQHNNKNIKLTLLASVDLKQGDGDVKEPLYIGLDFLPDGRLVAADYLNKKCLVYDQDLKKIGSVFLPDTPYDMTVITDENVAVSGGPKIYFIKISKSSQATVIRTLNVTMACYSIHVMTDNNFLVGCFDDQQPVRVLSVGGEERTLDINIPSRQYKLFESTCIYIKKSNKVVLSDRSANTVYIYDKANNTRVNVKHEKIIKKPRGMAVGPGDCIFVCSSHTNSLVQISNKGQILSSHVMDMEYPVSVCVSKDNTRLAVSGGAIENIKLKLFNIEQT